MSTKKQLPEKGALPPVTGKQNSRYVSASSLVSIKENEDMGRYAVAGKDVNVGDTLIIEPAFTAVLLGEHAETHCFHCFRRLCAIAKSIKNGKGIRERRGDGRKRAHYVAKKRAVVQFISKLRERESHYNRNKSQRLYLASDLNIAKLFNMYNESVIPDLRQMQPHPKLSISEAYYSRQLAFYALCVTDKALQEPNFFTWNEAQAGRGALKWHLASLHFSVNLISTVPPNALDCSPMDVVDKIRTCMLYMLLVYGFKEKHLLRLEAAVPCHTCSNVAFCSVACQTEALATHHAVECTILETLWASGASIICLMALRILSQRGLKYFLDLRDCLSKDCDVVKKSEKYCPTDYRTVYNLVGHSGARTPLDFLFRTDTAVLLFRCLKVAGFFSGQISESAHGLTSDEIFVGGLLLRHLQLLQFNAHEVSELQLEATNKLNSARSVFLGGGLFPTLALFNHACDPGIIR
ncbi:hypothetical protein ANN_17635 [Periplaneta americana]|uniref:MYND-type domain-containing protein n=1 Tax=Periplaneta americana TaxID=6978 RepID=A0ABQ8SUT9_PERAM|nr:hypothetical protein ANN_17635 [Periplaneta americana]